MYNQNNLVHIRKIKINYIIVMQIKINFIVVMQIKISFIGDFHLISFM